MPGGKEITKKKSLLIYGFIIFSLIVGSLLKTKSFLQAAGGGISDFLGYVWYCYEDSTCPPEWAMWMTVQKDGEEDLMEWWHFRNYHYNGTGYAHSGWYRITAEHYDGGTRKSYGSIYFYWEEGTVHQQDIRVLQVIEKEPG